jgi:fructokinase
VGNYNKSIIEDSLKISTILKLNELELVEMRKMFFSSNEHCEISLCRRLLEKFDLKLVCLTKGEQGSILVDKKSTSNGQIIPCKVADRVGAGDAFTAATIIQFLKGNCIEEINENANKLASWVTSKEGGMPFYNGNPLI